MHRKQAYLSVLVTFLFAYAAAQAEESTANQVLLAPGASITFTDTANPGINIAVTAPGDAYLNLSRLVADSEKGGIYSILSAVQVNAAGSVVSNADGSLSLRPASGQSYFVSKGAAPGPGRVTLEGGTAQLDRGQVVIHSARIAHAGVAAIAPGAPGTPALNAPPVVPTRPLATAGQSATLVTAPVRTIGPVGPPTGGMVVSGPVTQASVTSLPINLQATPAVGNFASFNVGGGTIITAPSGGVTVLQVQGGSISFTGSHSSATGNVVLSNPNGIVTVNQTPALSVGSLSITSPTSGLSMGGAIVQTGAKPPAPAVVVVPTR